MPTKKKKNVSESQKMLKKEKGKHIYTNLKKRKKQILLLLLYLLYVRMHIYSGGLYTPNCHKTTKLLWWRQMHHVDFCPGNLILMGSPKGL